MLSDFESKLTAIATAEFAEFGGHHEADPILSTRIETYWKELGMAFPGVDTPWSAVFVSFCVKRAGAKKAEFKFSAQHSQFVKAAIDNSQTGKGVFRGINFDEAAPAVGDIIQWNRPGEAFDFAHAASHDSYPSHSAIVVAIAQDGNGRFAQTIGGNEADTVGRTRVPLNAAGLIQQRTKMPFICLIQNLK